MKMDINCDLGENEPFSLTEAVAPFITSANIACGGHAGTADTMRACIRLALQHGLKVGAHPGLKDEHFGRRPCSISAEQLATLLLQQVSALETLAGTLGAQVHHVKLHGALYHAVDADESLREACLGLLQECWPSLIIYARAVGAFAREAQARGHFVWQEVFLDRNYRSSGELVARGEPDALLGKPEELQERLELLRGKKIRTIDGQLLAVEPQTLAIHADSPRALEFAKIARQFGW